MQRDETALNMVLRMFRLVIAQSLQSGSPGTAQVDMATLQIGAVAFIHRFSSSLNWHVHFHVCVVDGVFEARLPFDMDRLRKEGAALVYRCAKQHSEPGSDQCGAMDEGVHIKPDWDLAEQPAPDFDVDQHINW